MRFKLKSSTETWFIVGAGLALIYWLSQNSDSSSGGGAIAQPSSGGQNTDMGGNDFGTTGDGW